MAKGIDFIIKIGTDVLGGQRGATLNRSADEIDTTTKDGGGWTENVAGLRSWGIDSDGLIVEDNAAFLALEAAYSAGTPVTVVMQTAAGNQYTGQANITDFPVEGPHDAEATYSITLVGSGALSKVDDLNSVTFEITADAGGAAIEDASIEFNGQTKKTNNLGVAVFPSVADGTKTYTVYKVGFVTVSDSIVVDGDETEEVALVAV